MLQNEYGDRINVMGFTREDAETVTEFLTLEQSAGKTWDEVLSYRIAIDNQAKTNEAYMRAAGQGGIPCAFIVGKEGFVEWIGHPAAMDEPLANIVDGTWDRAAALAEREKKKQLEEAMASFDRKMSELMAAEDYSGAVAAIEDFSKLNPDMADQLLMARATILGKAGRREDQVSAFQEIIKKSPENPRLLNAIAWQIATEAKNGDLDFCSADGQTGE